MIHHITVSIKLFKNIIFIINSNKANNQAANCPQGGIGNANDPKHVWSYKRKLKLNRQVHYKLSGHQLGIIVQILKVSDS